MCRLLTVFLLLGSWFLLEPLHASGTEYKHEEFGAPPDWYLKERESREREAERGKAAKKWAVPSPDRKKTVIIKEVKDSFVMSVSDKSGKERRLLSSTQGFSVPSWSSDGSMIAFYLVTKVHEDYYLADIYVFDLRSMKSRVVKKDVAESADPAWAPVGLRLAFSDFGDIYMADVGAGNVEKIVSRGGYSDAGKGYPQKCASFVWSSDGRALIYEYKEDYFTERSGRYYIIKLSQ